MAAGLSRLGSGTPEFASLSETFHWTDRSTLGGGCQLPLGAIAVHLSGELEMQAIVTSADGSESVRRRARGDALRPRDLGKKLADELAEAGAIAILEKVRYS